MITVRPNRCCKDTHCQWLQIPASNCLFSVEKIPTESAAAGRKENNVFDSVFKAEKAKGDASKKKLDAFHRIDKLYVSKSGTVRFLLFFSQKA